MTVGETSPLHSRPASASCASRSVRVDTVAGKNGRERSWVGLSIDTFNRRLHALFTLTYLAGTLFDK